MRATILGLAVAAAGLAGCYDELPNAVVYNNTGESVVLVLNAAGRHPERLTLEAGAASRRVSAYGAARALEVHSGECLYKYLIPRMGVNAPFPERSYSYPVQAQLEPDLAFYLLPGQGPGDVAAIKADQPPGFPLRPFARACEELLK